LPLRSRWPASGRSVAWLGAPKNIAPGVDFYQVTDPTLVDPQAPIAVYLLRLDLDRVQIESGLSNDEVMMAERVDEIAQRHNAIAAINAGFFNVKNGEPAGLLKVAGELVSDTGSRAALSQSTPSRVRGSSCSSIRHPRACRRNSRRTTSRLSCPSTAWTRRASVAS
jgi:hypothetical protein